MAISQSEHFVPNQDGWLLHLKRWWSRDRLSTALPPVVIVPGYGMNAFIFGFHPRSTSMVRALAEAGFEVWTTNLRHQGDARRLARRPPPASLQAYAETDLPAVLDEVARLSESGRADLSVIGASLGGSIAYAHLALHRPHRVGRVITIGSPLRWVKTNPALALLMRAPGVDRLRIRGARQIARVGLPLLANTPLMRLYLNPKHVDLEHAATLTQTVDNPQPELNAELARWIKDKDLTLRGVNVSEAMRDVEVPLLIVAANRDGIVPQATALSPQRYWGAPVDVLHVGTDDDWYAHADLFVGNEAPQRVFEPMVRWLTSQAER